MLAGSWSLPTCGPDFFEPFPAYQTRTLLLDFSDGYSALLIALGFNDI